MACACPERSAPLPSDLPPGSNQRPRQWFVLRRNYSRSAFNGYKKQWSDFSDVMCRACEEHWRTKAGFVVALPDCEYWPNSYPPRVPAREQ